MRVRELSGRSALAACGPAFDVLSEECGSPVTARRPWLQAWLECYSDWHPWLVLVEDGSDLVAAAPLARRRRGGLEQVAGLGIGPTDDFRLPARHGDAATRLAAAVAAALQRRTPWFLRMEQLPVADPVVEALRTLLPQVQLRPGEGMPTIHVDSRELDRYLSKNTRKALAKISNKLSRDGLEPEITWTRDADGVRALLPELAQVHRARDEALGRRSDHDDPRASAFYHLVVSRHADRDEIDLLTVRLRGELAAFVCGFIDGTALRSWDNRLSPAWANYSAGRIANTEAIRHVVTSGTYNELDWMQGEEPYKLQSATEVVPTTDVYAWSSPTLRRSYALVDRARAAKRNSELLSRVWWRIRGFRQR